MTCSIEGCTSNRFSKGLCRKHYDKQHYQKHKIGFTDRTVRSRNEFTSKSDYYEMKVYDVNCNVIGVALLDSDDYEKCRHYKWYNHSGYIVNDKVGFMHHFVMGGKPNEGCFVDHKNRVRSDNRKSNLRIATMGQNNTNTQTRASSGLRGVTVLENNRGYKVQIAKDKIRYQLGPFKTMEEAANAYDSKAKELHGAFAVLNNLTNTASGSIGFLEVPQQHAD